MGEETAQPLRLNLGSGDTPLEGYVNIDRKSGGQAYPLDYADGSVDEVRASHVLEHFSHRQTLDVLKDWIRVLKPGGRLRVAVPDFRWCVERFARGEPTDHPIERYIMGAHVDDDDRHGSLFTERKLRRAMYYCGLTRLRRWKSEIEDGASLPLSLNLEGYKPERPEVKGVSAVMSVPRYGATAAFDCGYRALLPLAIPLRMGFGVYYSEVITGIIEEVIAEGAEYVLAVDYDTIFHTHQVRELYRLMLANPLADAICATQMRRGMPGALLVVRDENGEPLANVPRERFDEELIEAQSAHLGLTLIRASALSRLTRPWFQAAPDKDGGWRGEGYVGADVAMWRKFTGEGLRLFQANYVAVGHVEEVIIWPDRELRPLIQEMSEYRKYGMSEAAMR